MARKTKEPKKLHVERDGHKFKCSWKCGEEYDQGVQFRYSLGKWKKGPLPVGGIAYTTPFGDNGWLAVSKVYDLSKKADHKTVTGVDFSDYYPTTKVYLVSFSFSVRGNRKKHKEKKKNVDPEWSDWVNYGMFTIKNPPQMKMGTPQYEGQYYSKFVYAIPKETEHEPIVDYEWQACLTKGGESPDWNNPDKTGVRKKAATSEFYITEDKYKGRDIDWTEPNYSYTRHVRIRARGPGGPGAWSKVVTHVYTMAKPSTGVSARLIKNANQAGYLCQITWTAATDKTRPNDGNLAYYTFAVPTENMGCPDNATWEDVPGGMIRDTKDKDSYSFIISNSPPLDHVMFIRIDTTHDAYTTPGYPIFVKGSNIYPSLTPPVIGSVVPYIENYYISLSQIQNQSEVDGSFIGVYFRGGNDTSDGKLIGIITDTSVSTAVQCPAWNENGFALGLRTIAGATATASTVNETVQNTETIMKPIDQQSITFVLEKNPIVDTTITVNFSLGEYKYLCQFKAGSSLERDIQQRIIIVYDGNKTFTVSSPFYDEYSFILENVVYSCLPGEYEANLKYYELTPINNKIGIMQSEIAWSGDIPLPPSNLKVTQDGVNTILATWDWNWKEANTVEISWANHEDAWESTDEPQTYTIESVKASRWKIANLEPGNWYVKVRLIKNSDDASVYGTYATADKFPIKVSSAPSTPSLTLLPDTITADGSTTASWAYEAVDGTTQSEAEIFEAIDDGEGGYSYVSLDPPAKSTSAQFIAIYAETQGWKEGETHNLSVRVKSSVDELSEDYSPPKTVAIVAKPTVKIESTSLVSRTIVVDSGTEEDDTETTETVPNVLAYLPLEVTVAGAGEGGTTYLSIIRDGPYHGERPDGTNIDGFDGEIIASASHDGDGVFRIEKADRSGYFDDGASYKIHAMVKDSHGQVAETEEIMSIYTLTTDTEVNEDTEYYSYDSQTETYTKVDPEDGDNPSQQGWYTNRTYNSFIVVWDHQAVMPEADVEVDNDDDVVFITPRFYVLTTDTTVVSGTDYFSYDEDDGYVKVEPESGDNPYSEGWYVHGEPASGDTCDIYRLSADKPELIVTNGEFNTKYVDPYPTYGQFGGHRIVYITKEGDYTAGEIEAVKDFREEEGDIIDNRKVENFKTVIDFNNEKVELPYDLSVSLKWAKDVAVNKYLDGSVTADWNPAVDLSTTINTTAYVLEEPEMMLGLRRLAMWPGYCHVRTPDGSSFTADVQVSIDHEEKLINRLAKVSLSITRVDNYRYDGMTYEEWIASREPGE